MKVIKMNAALKHPGLQLRCTLCRMILVPDSESAKTSDRSKDEADTDEIKSIKLRCPGCGSLYLIETQE